MLNYVNNKFGKIHLAKFKCSIIFKKHVVKYVIGFWGAKFIYKSKVAFIDHHQQNINKHTKKKKKKRDYTCLSCFIHSLHIFLFLFQSWISWLILDNFIMSYK